MKDDPITSEEEFIKRCDVLMNAFKIANAVEQNGKVWAAVMANVLVQMFMVSDDTEGACEDFKSALTRFTNRAKEQKQSEEDGLAGKGTS